LAFYECNLTYLLSLCQSLKMKTSFCCDLCKLADALFVFLYLCVNPSDIFNAISLLVC
jgi:hypothetical protein